MLSPCTCFLIVLLTFIQLSVQCSVFNCDQARIYLTGCPL